MAKKNLLIIVLIIVLLGAGFLINRRIKKAVEELPVQEETNEEAKTEEKAEAEEIVIKNPETEIDPESGEINITIPNPAADFCHAQGYKYQTAVNSDGSQYGVCVFGETACPGWEYYQGKCQPGERPIKYIN